MKKSPSGNIGDRRRNIRKAVYRSAPSFWGVCQCSWWVIEDIAARFLVGRGSWQCTSRKVGRRCYAE